MQIKQGTKFTVKEDFKGLKRNCVYQIISVSGGTVTFAKVFDDALIKPVTIPRASFDKLKKQEYKGKMLR